MIRELLVITIPFVLLFTNPISIETVKGLKNPVANDQYVSTNTNSTVKIILTGSEAKNAPLKFSIVRPALHGNLSGTVPNLNYTPAINFGSGIDTFTFKVNNGTADANKCIFWLLPYRFPSFYVCF